MAPAVKMPAVQKMMTLFLGLQKEHNIHESFNVVDAKWTMRDIMTQVNDTKLTEKLIKFYFIMSDSKTWEEFTWEYHNYLDSWNAYVIANQRRAHLQRETMEQALKKADKDTK